MLRQFDIRWCWLTLIKSLEMLNSTLFLVLYQSEYRGGERWLLALVEDPALVSGVGHGIHQGVPANV
jgi:hypothetical protein